MLVFATSEEENVAVVEMKNPDGETNLKSRNTLPALTHLRGARDLADRRNHYRVGLDRPGTNLYKLNGAVVLPGEEKSSVDINMILLRGSVVRNTSWFIRLVLYTGKDSRIVPHSGATPGQRSEVEREMNPYV